MVREKSCLEQKLVIRVRETARLPELMERLKEVIEGDIGGKNLAVGWISDRECLLVAKPVFKRPIPVVTAGQLEGEVETILKCRSIEGLYLSLKKIIEDTRDIGVIEPM